MVTWNYRNAGEGLVRQHQQMAKMKRQHFMCCQLTMHSMFGVYEGRAPLAIITRNIYYYTSGALPGIFVVWVPVYPHTITIYHDIMYVRFCTRLGFMLQAVKLVLRPKLTQQKAGRGLGTRLSCTWQLSILYTKQQKQENKANTALCIPYLQPSWRPPLD